MKLDFSVAFDATREESPKIPSSLLADERRKREEMILGGKERACLREQRGLGAIDNVDVMFRRVLRCMKIIEKCKLHDINHPALHLQYGKLSQIS